MVVSRGTLHDACRLPGLAAFLENSPVGLLTYHVQGRDCEIVTLNSLQEGMGIGTQLIKAVLGMAMENDCARIWLITTNDNINALKFYQKRGFQLVAVHRNAVEKSRILKPQIPETGQNGIVIRDEIELEMRLR
jgi:ribosomal protein S18 acetylase RimI-like enzyme